ncbi:MAG: 50S ribosomal protein L2 [Candidatus Pacebacteria bacterium]|nr:50S ribosomal protein L2 [Candidatus Paceibacterota bacterium]
MKKYKPITPSRRHYSVSDSSMLTATKPYKPLTSNSFRNKGRSHGTITTRHRGGGNKKLYRQINFGEEKQNIKGRVKSIEYDPFRSAFIALISYQDGSWFYILAPHNLKVNDEIICSDDAPLRIGNRLKLKNVPPGTLVHNVEVKSGKGGQLGRSAGSAIVVTAQEDRYTTLKMPSSEIRKVSSDCFASVGQLSNVEHNLESQGKAGRVRHSGKRPVVRGKVMNPREHPYGGGEGRTQRGTRKPKDIWGNVTGGKKTRKRNKYSNKFILQRRKKKK